MAHQYATVTDTHVGLEHIDTAQLEGARKKKKKKKNAPIKVVISLKGNKG